MKQRHSLFLTLELLQNFPTRPLTQISCCSLFFLLWRSFSVADAGLRLAIGTFQNRTATQRGRGHLFPEKFQAGAASGGGAREDCSMRQGVGESDSEVPCTSGMVGDRGVSPCPSPHSQGWGNSDGGHILRGKKKGVWEGERAWWYSEVPRQWSRDWRFWPCTQEPELEPGTGSSLRARLPPSDRRKGEPGGQGRVGMAIAWLILMTLTHWDWHFFRSLILPFPF